jgi:hypothetical protein
MAARSTSANGPSDMGAGALFESNRYPPTTTSTAPMPANTNLRFLLGSSRSGSFAAKAAPLEK